MMTVNNTFKWKLCLPRFNNADVWNKNAISI
uniref:Uncharacterized protein n=1 Tax=Populus trichocarpa TaxID=3694 RepID=A0A3N7FMV8_POPTR